MNGRPISAAHHSSEALFDETRFGTSWGGDVDFNFVAVAVTLARVGARADVPGARPDVPVA